MRTIETTGTVTADHQLLVRCVPTDVAPGEHAVVVTIDPTSRQRDLSSPLFRSAYPISLSNPQIIFSREDIYEDVDR